MKINTLIIKNNSILSEGFLSLMQQDTVFQVTPLFQEKDCYRVDMLDETGASMKDILVDLDQAKLAFEITGNSFFSTRTHFN